MFGPCVCSVCVILDQNKALEACKNASPDWFSGTCEPEYPRFSSDFHSISAKNGLETGLFALPLRVPLPKWLSFFFFRVCNFPMATLVRPDTAQHAGILHSLQMIFDPIRCQFHYLCKLQASYSRVASNQVQDLLGSFLGSLPGRIVPSRRRFSLVIIRTGSLFPHFILSKV